MKVAVLFEASGIVRDAFAKAGHEATSYDILPSASPGNHYECDLTQVHPSFFAEYDLIIAHPPCTALSVSGNRYYANTSARIKASELVYRIWQLPCPQLAIENPVGVINRLIPSMPRPYYIQPWQFGHDASKKTGLWTRGLPRLTPTDIIKKDRYANQTPSGQSNLPESPDRARLRSLTYQGIADAMADQWTEETFNESA